LKVLYKLLFTSSPGNCTVRTIKGHGDNFRGNHQMCLWSFRGSQIPSPFWVGLSGSLAIKVKLKLSYNSCQYGLYHHGATGLMILLSPMWEESFEIMSVEVHQKLLELSSKYSCMQEAHECPHVVRIRHLCQGEVRRRKPGPGLHLVSKQTSLTWKDKKNLFQSNRIKIM
jgi:hypothetical protein